MRYRPLALAAGVATLASMHVASATAQSAYVAPGGIYIGAGAGPVHVTPGDAAFRAAAYPEPGYDCGYGGAAYVDRYAYGVGAYEEPGYGCGCEPGPYVTPRYGYGYGPAPVPNYGYGYDQCHRLVTDMDQRRCHVVVDMDHCPRPATAMDMDQSRCPITIMDMSQYRVAMATVQHLATAMDTGQCRVPHTDRRRVTNGPLRG